MSWRDQVRFDPSHWVSLRPFGTGSQKPEPYGEMARAAWDNRAHPRYAWQVLTKGVCDGCALGVAGLHDWTIDGIHLCTSRLRLLELNTSDPFDPIVVSDVAAIRGHSAEQLRRMGRLGYPLRRRRGEPGFERIGWDLALETLAGAIRDTNPERIAIYLTSRGLTNETYYVAGKAARAMGIRGIDSAARVCHAPSTLGLKASIGVAAATCSLQDVLESELVVIWGANPANNQPVFMKYLYLAKQRGCRVVVVNPYLEPGLEAYWVPSNLESALFGTRICDLHIPVRPGGDVAFANAALKLLMERGELDRGFIERCTLGWDELEEALAGQAMGELLRAAGLSIDQVSSFCDEYSAAGSAILLWSMGITQHVTAVDGVRAIVNLALARGNVGRDGAGLMPLRGHSGVQGGAEMGAYATALPGGLDVDEVSCARLSRLWGFPIPAGPGMTAPEMVDAALDGDLDVLWASGGNFLEVLPERERVRRALERVPLRVHQDIVLTNQMLLPGDEVLLLPVRTRYEQEGGGTETTTERRIVYSPEIPRPVGEARSEWRLFADVAQRVRPEYRPLFSWPDNRALRTEIAAVVPAYAGIETLAETGDQVQWGGRHLCRDGDFPTPSRRASFSALEVSATALGTGFFTVATRRGKQFNSIVQGQVDPQTGAARDAVFMDRDDAAELGLGEGARVRLVSDFGAMEGRLKLVRLPSRSLQVYWPEGNALIDPSPAHRDPRSKIPDYNAIVTVEAVR
ncbi:MAG: Protein YdeP [Acidimicrobiales bacterium]|nr:MAG: formate dehydrogenase [Actinomycetota bacterium]MBV6508499.1 Protein YdeP [Acidimicrobiales bacterium]RIK05185.1 MAG: formate dehydrogenase [Acidobacteriota bacterium]